MQRVELPATLALALILDPASPRERQREHVCEFRSADDLARNVADDAAEHRADAPQGSGGPLELLGVGIALLPDQRDLADPHVRALAPARQRRAVERKLMAEELLAAEQLVVRVLDPALAYTSSERSCMCLRIANPAINRVGSGGRPGASV